MDKPRVDPRTKILNIVNTAERIVTERMRAIQAGKNLFAWEATNTAPKYERTERVR